jgi:beta-lactam-binding protein with PASTA domain
VLGRDYREAVALLGRKRLRVSYSAEVTAAPANTIVFQRPAPGSNVIEGTIEYITISTGPNPVVRVRVGD